MFSLPDEITLCMDYIKSLKHTAGISEETLAKMVHDAIRIGEDAASDYIGANIIEQAEKSGITLKMMEGGVFGERLLRAQYDDSVKAITVYTDGITSILNTPGAEVIGIIPTVEKVREVLLWHEFFHVLEYTKLGLLGDKFKVPGKMLWFKVEHPLYQISEISANVFAKKVMGLKYNPLVLDYICKNKKLYESEGTCNEIN